jgi:hypothetical protein
MTSSVRVDLASQKLLLLEEGYIIARYDISSAANGVGTAPGSECTPAGDHRIRLKIGEGCPLNTVFVGRRPTGEIFSEELAKAYPDRDWILTRILWLTGVEPAVNRFGACDTLKRFIYIHGTAEEELLGQPVSHGCIRMGNSDMIELYNAVSNNTLVSIQE